MFKSKSSKSWSVVCSLLVGVFLPMTLGILPTPHFGPQIAVLYFPGWEKYADTIGFRSELSPQGDFVVGRVDGFDGYGSNALLMVWDTHQITFDAPLNVIEPANTTEVPAYSDFAISPDDRYVAVQSVEGIRILSLPDLQQRYLIPVVSVWLTNDFPSQVSVVTFPRADEDQTLAWSNDGHYLAVFLGTQVVVWNLETQQIHRLELGITVDYNNSLYSGIQNMKSSWLIDIYSPASLILCRWNLDDCHDYPGFRLINASHENVILVESAMQTDAPVQSLVRGGNGLYVLDELHIDPAKFPEGFSPHGNYLVVRDRLEERSILNFTTNEPLNTFELVRPVPPPPAWFSDEGYYIAMERFLVLSLWQTHRSELVNVLDLEALDKSFDLAAMSRSDTLTIQIDQNDDWCLVNLGVASLLIPIRYE